ncbi:aspartate--tRNA ligase msd1 [Rhizina undulata]
MSAQTSLSRASTRRNITARRSLPSLSRGLATEKSDCADSSEQTDASSTSNEDFTSSEEPSEEVDGEVLEKKEPLSEAEKFLAKIKYKPSSVEEVNGSENETPAASSMTSDRKMLNSYKRLLDSAADEEFEGIESIRLPKIKSEKRYAVADDKVSNLPPELEDVASKFDFPSATHRVQDLNDLPLGEEVVVHGFIASSRLIGKALGFLDLIDFSDKVQRRVQITSTLPRKAPEELIARRKEWFRLPPFMPVAVMGRITEKKAKNKPKSKNAIQVDIDVKTIIPLNSVSKDLIYTRETLYPPTQRHLQLRTSYPLWYALRLRAKAASVARNYLEEEGFLEVETPLLFKSTPEGAREFLVPTRSKENGGGMCYALPQSPQQYKQILMASGVSKYYQIARCFRDEDLRADRQPEFTQLDLEMSFATSEDVMQIIERLVKRIWKEAHGWQVDETFKRMTYMEAMRKYGTDKPDLRYAKWKLAPLNKTLHQHVKPNVFYEGLIFWFDEKASDEKRKEFLESYITEFQGKGDAEFVAYLADDSEVLKRGIAAYGFTPNDISEINERLKAVPGSIVIIHKRTGEPSGGSTRIGFLRNAIIAKARNEGLVHEPSGYRFLWVTEFPLFSPSTDAEPGQSGTAGLSSTHHPFTAPLAEDLHLLADQPEKVRAEHYDLVVNGVELGGGSRRIHDAALQKYVLKSVLKVPEEKLRQFDHLLNVLDSGCPPHAGIALGFDRLIAVLSGAGSLRDVIAFPKNSKGADVMVGSPSLADEETLRGYYLRRIEGVEEKAVE